MSLPVPEKFHNLFHRPLLCALTTVNPDGQPHSVPVWCDFDGEHVRVNMPAATKKARNLRVNPRLTLLAIDPHNPGHWIEIQGHVGKLNDEAHGARDHINKLSEKYTGNPVYQPRGASGIDHQMYVIEAVKINGHKGQLVYTLTDGQAVRSHARLANRTQSSFKARQPHLTQPLVEPGLCRSWAPLPTRSQRVDHPRSSTSSSPTAR